MQDHEKAQLDNHITDTGESRASIGYAIGNPPKGKTYTRLPSYKPLTEGEYLISLIFDAMPRQGYVQRLPATDAEFDKRCKQARQYAGSKVTDTQWTQAINSVRTRLTATQTRIAQMHALNMRKYHQKARRNRDIRKDAIIASEAWITLTKSYDRDDVRLKAKALEIFNATLAY